MNKKKYVTNSNVKFNYWYDVEEYNLPFYVPDTFECEQLLIGNIYEQDSEKVQLIDTPCQPLKEFKFESVYVDEDDIIATHFMIPYIKHTY